MGQRVLITGHRGYLGSVMAPRLLEAGHEVHGVDAGLYAGCDFVPDPAAIPTVAADIRDLTARDLEGFDAVIHLAALSNDPLGSLNPDWTDEINLRGSVNLARLAKQAGVRRFLFSSSCIMYGTAHAAEVDEDSPLAPQTAYARSKVAAEAAIAAMAGPAFSPIFLRNGTVYGVSPRMRFDTVLNNLVGSALTTGEVVIHGDGKPWRPVVHIDDVASVFLAALEAPVERIHNQAINAGSAEINCQIGRLAQLVAAAVPGCRLRCLASPDADRRTYQASFAKIARVLPEFRLRWRVEDGVHQLTEALLRRGLTLAEFRSDAYTRLRWLARLRLEGRLDQGLRWIEIRAVVTR